MFLLFIPGELEGVFEEVEDALMNLEDVIEIQELQERQLDHRFQLAMYKEKKLADFEDMKGTLKTLILFYSVFTFINII